ncbi:hypothetical protein CRM22_004674 [Opisthorchis felineus]|uniref:Uncharacterized protein n=1 Tax=Opisthorchis felineus TaxID=147828 RepID=A0A4V3SFA0_OPIFE|nr:hypothetical protein CRM22_004674 [Opisthorchis felineus]
MRYDTQHNQCHRIHLYLSHPVVLSPGANCDSISKDALVPAADSPQVCRSSSGTAVPSSPTLPITTGPLIHVASERSSTPVSSRAIQVSQDSFVTNSSVHSETTSVATTSTPLALSSSALPVSTTASPSVRRVPDPALSHLFQSAALFHPYQPHCEQDKANSTAGGGLFDDWVDSSSKTADLIACAIHLPFSVDGTYSGSVSGPSSVIGKASHAIQAPQSVGGTADMPTYMSQSPQSVPSNYSSYPTTPGGGLPSISSVQTNHVSSVVASPSHLIKGINSRSTLPSPSVRLFDNLESRTGTHEPNLEDQPRIAAYICPTCRSCSSLNKSVA